MSPRLELFEEMLARSIMPDRQASAFDIQRILLLCCELCLGSASLSYTDLQSPDSGIWLVAQKGFAGVPST